MTRRLCASFALLILAAFAAGCGDGTTSPSSTPDVDALAARLNAAGLAVVRAGQVDQPFFAVPGQVLAAGNAQIQVFVFSSPESAATAAASVSSDGGTIGTTSVSWTGPPHFYRSSNLIVLYVGGEASVLSALVQVLGPQFAGA